MPAMKPAAYTLAILPILGALGTPTLAHAATGLGNLTYTAQELFKPVANFGGETVTKWPTGPTGANTVVMIHQKLVIMASLDSGKPPGSLHVYDVSDPRKPVLQKTLDGTPETSKLRELHAMPVAMIDGKSILVLPTTTGIQFFDFTDPLNPKPAGTFDLAGAAGGDYDNTVWMLSWQWPYVFAGGTGNGIFVVDATDPANCKLVPRITTGMIGNFRIGPTYAAGNYLIGMNMDQPGTQVAVIDVGDPAKPSLLSTGRTAASLYSAVVVGDRIYGPGTLGSYVIMAWSPTTVTELVTGKSGADRGGYCTYQSGFAICGQSSEGFKKWDTRGDKLTLMGIGTDPAAAGGDFDFSTILGNLVFLGNDHGTGSAFIPHQTAPDTVAPEVLKVYPNEAKQKLSTRVTIFFSEDIDLDTVTPANIIVRPSGGAAVPGVFSRSSFNAISFGAKAPLAADTTYEVVIPAGGVADLVGNPIAQAVTARFSTGATIDTSGGPGDGGVVAPRDATVAPVPEASTPPVVDAGGAGGSTGTGGSGGTGGDGTAGAGPVVAGSGGSTTDPGTGGSAGTPVTPPTAPPAADSGGCGCTVPGGAAPASAWALALGAIGIGIARRRGRDKRRGGTGQA